MSRLAAGEFTRLAMDLDRLPQNELFEYAVKGPLITASAVFQFEKTQTGYSAQALIEGKIPFKGQTILRGYTDLQGLPEGNHLSAFGRYSEQQDKKLAQTWAIEGDLLTQRREVENLLLQSIPLGSSEPDFFLARTLLNPLLLLNVFCQAAAIEFSISKGLANNKTLVAQFVVSNKIYAIRFERTDIGDYFLIYAMPVQAPLVNLVDWVSIDWPQKEMLTIQWDSKLEVVKNFRVKIPVLGAIEIPLVQHSRD